MARRCEHCGKGPRSGNRVSHANNRTRMRQLPNLQTVRLNENGRTVTRRLCTRCIRNGGFVKAV